MAVLLQGNLTITRTLAVNLPKLPDMKCGYRFDALLALLSLCIFCYSLNGQSREIDIGVITGQKSRKAIPVQIMSADKRVQGLMRRAFSTHGAFTIAANRGAAFTFTFTPMGLNSIRLSIESGVPPQVQFTRDVSGGNWRDASLRAGDLAVLKTTGSAGYFAGQIAYIGGRAKYTEIFLADLFLVDRRQVTRDGAKCVRPEISPDGRLLLYTGYFRNGFPEIFSINLATGKRDLFAGFRGLNIGARFNPDGDAVALILSGTGNAELYISNTRGRDLRRLTHTPYIESDPSWSPNGQRIVLTSDKLGKPQIFTIPAAGGAMRRVPTNISRYCAEPDWNPRNPNIVAFTANMAGEFEVALYDFSTAKSNVITRGRGDAVEPCWTNDGRHLIYTERTSRYQRLVLLDTETGRATPLHDRNLGDTSQARYYYPSP